MSSSKCELKSTMHIMPKLWKGMKISSQHQGHVIIRHWRDIVGEDIAKNVIPVRYEQEKLFLTASSSSWSNEIMLMKLDIMDRINRYMKGCVVKELVFQRDSGKACASNKQSSQAGQQAGDYLKMDSVTLNSSEIGNINSSCQNIKSSELRSRVERSLLDMKKLEHMHLQSGWHKCQKCGRLVDPRYKMCLSCENESINQHRRQLRDYLRVVPWATYADICNELNGDIEDSEYIECKKELIQELARNLKFSDQDTADASILVMLKTGCTPDKLSKEVIYKTFKRLRYDLADAKDFFDKNKIHRSHKDVKSGNKNTVNTAKA